MFRQVKPISLQCDSAEMPLFRKPYIFKQNVFQNCCFFNAIGHRIPKDRVLDSHFRKNLSCHSILIYVQSLLRHNRHETGFLKPVLCILWWNFVGFILWRSGLWRASVPVGMTKPIPKSNSDATRSMTSPFPSENPECVQVTEILWEACNTSIVNCVSG